LANLLNRTSASKWKQPAGAGAAALGG